MKKLIGVSVLVLAMSLVWIVAGVYAADPNGCAVYSEDFYSYDWGGSTCVTRHTLSSCNWEYGYDCEETWCQNGAWATTCEYRWNA